MGLRLSNPNQKASHRLSRILPTGTQAAQKLIPSASQFGFASTPIAALASVAIDVLGSKILLPCWFKLR
jgi:hypothetical protein